MSERTGYGLKILEMTGYVHSMDTAYDAVSEVGSLDVRLGKSIGSIPNAVEVNLRMRPRVRVTVELLGGREDGERG